jgi:soluble lytic murein transglycosylase-like protein
MLEALIAALLVIAPNYLDKDSASINAMAAIAAAKDTGLDPILLLSIGYVESRYNPLSLSRMQGSRRVTGVWEGNEPPSEAKPSWYCGIMQVGGWVEWNECQELRTNIVKNYQVGANHLVEWKKLCKNDLKCALRGYSGGWDSIKAGRNGYINSVFGVMVKLKKMI